MADILLVEPAAQVVEYLLGMLARHNVTQVPYAAMARSIMAEGRKFDLLITADNLRGQSGLELIGWTRTHCPRALRTVLMSPSEPPSHKAHGFVKKPKYRGFVAIVDRLLASQPTPATIPAA